MQESNICNRQSHKREYEQGRLGYKSWGRKQGIENQEKTKRKEQEDGKLWRRTQWIYYFLCYMSKRGLDGGDD